MNIRLVVCLTAIIVTLVTASGDSGETISYSGYKVWKIDGVDNDRDTLELLLSTWIDIDGVDFWNEVSPMRIMVAPHLQYDFQQFLDESGIRNAQIIIEDVEKALLEERKEPQQQQQQQQTRDVPDLEHYWSITEINKYLNYLAFRDGDTAHIDIVSTTRQGRLIRGLKITEAAANETSNSGRNQTERPLVIIDAGMHAREWITPMTAIYFIQQLVQNNTYYEDILSGLDLIIIPSVNPDGYEYSRTTDRFWRKTRAWNNGSICYGVDINRNYGYKWQEARNPCSGLYPGSEPFSEPETQALKHILDKYNGTTRLYISLHAQARLLLYPWGYDNSTKIDNWQEHELVGKRFADAIRTASGQNYTIGHLVDLIASINGGSGDYAASRGVNLSYTLDLPGGGDFGFDLPASQIAEAAQEVWVGVQEILRYVADKKW